MGTASVLALNFTNNIYMCVRESVGHKIYLFLILISQNSIKFQRYNKILIFDKCIDILCVCIDIYSYINTYMICIDIYSYFYNASPYVNEAGQK